MKNVEDSLVDESRWFRLLWLGSQRRITEQQIPELRRITYGVFACKSGRLLG